jgi:23S rRNA pseudouridine1911/1915/1917 synthase
VLFSRAVKEIRIPFQVEANYAGWRLDRYLTEKIQRLSREKAQELIAHRLVTDDGRVLKASTRVQPGLSFFLLKTAEPEPETPMEFGVVHDDGALIVVDKPAGLPIHPTARYHFHTFTALAKARFPGRKVDPGHRLDRETSGLLACGAAPVHTGKLKDAFSRGQVEKTYLALAVGEPREERFTVDAPLALSGQSEVRVRMHVIAGGLPSITEFVVRERRTAADGTKVVLLACHPRTGRQHQIRAHLAAAGLPLVGDKIYGADERIFIRFTEHALTDADRVALRLPRHALHAAELSLPHPVSGERVSFTLPLPQDLQAFWDSCRQGTAT